MRIENAVCGCGAEVPRPRFQANEIVTCKKCGSVWEWFWDLDDTDTLHAVCQYDNSVFRAHQEDGK